MKEKVSPSNIIEKNKDEIASSPAINDPFTGPIIATPARKQVKAKIVPTIIIAKSARIVIKSKFTFIVQGFTINPRKTPPINIPKPVTTILEYFFKIFKGSIEYTTTERAAIIPQKSPVGVITRLLRLKCVAKVNVPRIAKNIAINSIFLGSLLSIRHTPIIIKTELKN